MLKNITVKCIISGNLPFLKPYIYNMIGNIFFWKITSIESMWFHFYEQNHLLNFVPRCISRFKRHSIWKKSMIFHLKCPLYGIRLKDSDNLKNLWPIEILFCIKHNNTGLCEKFVQGVLRTSKRNAVSFLHH